METQPHTTSLSLLKGVFSRQDALDLITQLVEVKIRFHEKKMKDLVEVEDLKMREKRIQSLQSELHALRTVLGQAGPDVELTSTVHLQV